ncbi:MAG: phosphodiester glycosidase family protein [Clostridia bacterium]|nr:phosphodiester glycosidase family protein [Clostridia bacterium]
MNKFFRFVTSLSIVLIMLATTFSSYSYADWKTVFYEEKKEEFIGKGIKHEQILRFTDAGWYNINVIRADVNSKYVSLSLLSNENGIGIREKLSELVNQNEDVIAAVNGDFFNTRGAASLGPMVSDSELLSTPFYIPEQMAAFNMDLKDNPSIDFWTTPHITITDTNSQEKIEIATVNKETDYHDIAVIYTPKWGSNTPPLSNNLESAVEMVISDDMVLDICPASPAGNPIPSDGYVVFATGSHADIIHNFFSIGDEVDYDIQSDIDFSKLSMSIGGGAVLVENGMAKDVFTHEIKGRHPRTALGITRDEEEVLLVTVDGRTTSFPGLSQQELAEIMIDLGAYSAINLDGGGSTDMILRPLGDENTKVINHLSDGTERRIANGIGVISTASKASLKGISLNTIDTNVFANTPREVTIKGYDRNYNPVIIDPSDVRWSVDGVSGTIQDGIFMPASSGDAVITAHYKNTKATIEIKVLETPTAITITPSKINMPTGSAMQLFIKAVDSKGYSALIDTKSVNLDVPNHIGFIDGQGVFKSSDDNSTGIIKASYGELTAYTPVVVGEEKIIIDDFENSNGVFSSYPSVVTGSYGLVSFSKAGKYGGEIVFDFSTTDATRAAYLVFNDGGIQLDKEPEKIGLWVYGNDSGGHGIKVKLTDGHGTSENIVLASSIDWSGWQFIEAKLPGTLSGPIRVERVYVVETNPLSKETGKVYIDDLTVSYPLSFQGDIPAAVTKPMDLNHKKSPLETDSAFRFFAHGNVSGIDTLGDNLIVAHMAEFANEQSDLSVFSQNLDESLGSRLSNPVVVAHHGYSFTQYNDSGFIALDNHNRGLRQGNIHQWPWLLNTLEQIKVKKLFITLPKSPVFKDKLEEKLFKDTLNQLVEDENMDVWVLYEGEDQYKVTLENGIHYVALKTYPSVNKIDIFSDLDTMIFTVNEDMVTYEILPLFPLN